MQLDDALDHMSGYVRDTLERELFLRQREMSQMYWKNYAVTSYREQLRAQKESLTVSITPHKPGDGGILTLPLRSNIPSPKNKDWKLITCPVCGSECWESDLTRQALTAEPNLRAACTSCALKQGLRENEAEPPVDGATPRMGKLTEQDAEDSLQAAQDYNKKLLDQGESWFTLTDTQETEYNDLLNMDGDGMSLGSSRVCFDTEKRGTGVCENRSPN